MNILTMSFSNYVWFCGKLVQNYVLKYLPLKNCMLLIDWNAILSCFRNKVGCDLVSLVNNGV
jgi:hypothetical protein